MTRTAGCGCLVPGIGRLDALHSAKQKMKNATNPTAAIIKNVVITSWPFTSLLRGVFVA